MGKYVRIFAKEIQEGNMNKISNKEDIILIEKIAYSIGIELSTLNSLINFLELGESNKLEVSNVDVANLISVLKEKIVKINKDYSTLEEILGI